MHIFLTLNLVVRKVTGRL